MTDSVTKNENGETTDKTLNGPKTAFGIFKTNACGTGDGKVGIFPTIARINHSCVPNAHYYPVSNAEGQATDMALRAIKKISVGDEITISYIDPLQRRDFDTKENRCKILSEEFGFDCDCLACEKSLDDKARARIAEIEGQGVPNLIQEQYMLCKRANLHAGPLYLVGLKLLVAMKLQADIPGIRSLCREIIDHALIAYGKDAMMVPTLKRILSANDTIIVDVLIEELP